MKIVFFVQGEGRGHLTQALVMQEHLEALGHELIGVIVGQAKNRKIPEYFFTKIKAPIILIDSPHFVFGKNKSEIKIGATIWKNLKRLPHYLKSIGEIKKQIKLWQPDLVINFYVLLGNLYYFSSRPKTPLLSVGHQYFCQHPDFRFPTGHFLDRQLFKIYNHLNSLGVSAKLALSFRPAKDRPEKKIFVLPPLIRQQIIDQKTADENFILIYLLVPGYAKIIMDWHANHREAKLEVFCDQEILSPHPNLVFHTINDENFIAKLATCSGYMSTAGFDSVGEALWLEKAIYLTPTAGHFEQLTNAQDAQESYPDILSGAQFDLDKFSKYIKGRSFKRPDFEVWEKTAREKIKEVLEKISKQ